MPLLETGQRRKRDVALISRPAFAGQGHNRDVLTFNLSALSWGQIDLIERQLCWCHRQVPRTHYATAFCEMLAEYVREVFPITRPSGLTPRSDV